MDEKKYLLIEHDRVIQNGKLLYRIQAVKDFADVKINDLGGYIQCEDNLSHEGDCWIYDQAKVLDTAKISGNSKVYQNAIIYDNAQVYDEAIVSGNAQIFDNAKVFNSAVVYDKSQIFGNSEVKGFADVSENTKIFDNAQIGGKVKISGNSKVFGNAQILNNARLSDNSQVSEQAQVTDNARLFGNAEVSGNAYIFGFAQVQTLVVNEQISSDEPFYEYSGCSAETQINEAVEDISVTDTANTVPANYSTDMLTVLLSNRDTGEMEVVKIGFDWVIFFLGNLFGVPLFLKKLTNEGLIILGLILVQVMFYSALIVPAGIITGVIMEIYIIYLAFVGNQKIAHKCLELGYKITEKNPDKRNYIKIKWQVNDSDFE